MIPCNTRVVHRPSGAKGRVWYRDKEEGVLCLVETFPINYIMPEIPGTEMPLQPGDFTHWSRKDLLIVDTNKECPFCYGTGHSVGE